MKTMKKVLAAVLLVVMIFTVSSVAFASASITTTGKCNLRQGPALNYKSQKRIPNGTTLEASDSKTDERGVKWFKVTYKGASGWVSSKYVKNGANLHIKTVVANGNTRVRAQGNTSAKKLGTLHTGNSVTYLDESVKDARGIVWYKVNYKGNVGWVSSKYTTVKC